MFHLDRIACALAFGFALAAGSLKAQEIVAHRGASFDAPENTLAAFHEAWKQGADAVEGDFYLSKDNQIVCIHDGTTKRTGNKDLKVSESTYAELQTVDVGSWKNPKFASERIPTLAEVLKTIPEGKKIFIEIKCGPEIVPHLPAVLDQSGLKREQLVVICFNAKVVEAVRRDIPSIKAHWLSSFKKNEETGVYTPGVDEVIATLKKTNATGLDVNANRQVVDATFVKRLRDEKKEFHCWTVNDPEVALHFQKLGVDSITTDRPALIREKLGLNR